LDLLETATLNESSFCLKVLRKNLGELCADISKDIVRCELEERFEGRNMSAHLDNVLECLL
jgi:hypothetical protein